jgi:predicted ATPase
MGPVRDLRVSYTGTTQTVVCDVGLPRRVPIGYAGEGLVRLLKIILAMTWVEQGLVLVDEIENGVHYSVQEAFWRALAGAAREFDCQVIATTHSYEILRAAHAGLQSLFEPDFRYIRLERKGAETKAVTFTYENLGTALEAMWEVR